MGVRGNGDESSFEARGVDDSRDRRRDWNCILLDGKFNDSRRKVGICRYLQFLQASECHRVYSGRNWSGRSTLRSSYSVGGEDLGSAPA